MHSELPEDWAQDELSKYLDHSISNCVASFVNIKGHYNAIKEIDDLFLKAGQSIDHTEEVYPAMLFYRAFSSFRTAVYLIMAGHQIESFAIMRQAIEYSLYSNHLFNNPISIDIWLNRSVSKSKKQKSRNEFAFTNVIKSIKDPRILGITKELYEHFIDYGAHPNEASVLIAMLIEPNDKNVHLKQTFLSCEDESITITLKTIMATGVCMLNIFMQIWHTRFQLTGLDLLLKNYDPK